MVVARTQDPQYVLHANVKQSTKSDSEVITFSRWTSGGLVEECFIVPIPDEGRESLTVFVKVKKYDSPPPRYFASLPRDNRQDRGRDERPSGQTPEDKVDTQDRS